MSKQRVQRNQPAMDVVNLLRQQFWQEVNARHENDFTEAAQQMVEGSMNNRDLNATFARVVNDLEAKGLEGIYGAFDRIYLETHARTEALRNKLDAGEELPADGPKTRLDVFNAAVDTWLKSQAQPTASISAQDRAQLEQLFLFSATARAFRALFNGEQAGLLSDVGALQETEQELHNRLTIMWAGNDSPASARLDQFKAALTGLGIKEQSDRFYTRHAEEWITQNQSKMGELIRTRYRSATDMADSPAIKKFTLEVVKDTLMGHEQVQTGFFSRVFATHDDTPLLKTYGDVDNIIGSGKRVAFEEQLRNLVAPRQPLVGSPG